MILKPLSANLFVAEGCGSVLGDWLARLEENVCLRLRSDCRFGRMAGSKAANPKSRISDCLVIGAGDE